jgi:hypothetical protein
MPAWRCSDVAETMDNAARKIDRASRLDFGPAIVGEKADASLDQEKQFIFVRVDVRWRPTARRRATVHQGKHPAGLLSSEQDRDNVAEQVKIFGCAGLNDDRFRL